MADFAASYEARAFGVREGMPGRRARTLSATHFVSGHSRITNGQATMSPKPIPLRISPEEMASRGRKRLFGGSSSDSSARPRTANALIALHRERLKYSDGALHALMSDSTTGRRGGSIHFPFWKSRLEFLTERSGVAADGRAFFRFGRGLLPKKNLPEFESRQKKRETSIVRPIKEQASRRRDVAAGNCGRAIGRTDHPARGVPDA